MKVCLVSHRLGGFDGVSVEAAKWGAAFTKLGWPVTRAAGWFADHEPGDVVVRGLWADRPGGEPPPVDHATVKQLCADHDLLVLDNAGSLWSAPPASAAWERHALDAGIPTILRHHDPAWQGTSLRSTVDDMVPLHHPSHLHVLINTVTRNEFAHRWTGLTLRVVHNRVALTNGDRESVRAQLSVAPEELLILHPARVEAANKNIPGAIGFAGALAEKLGRPVRYWLTDETEAGTGLLDGAPGLVRGQVTNQADMYAAADLVVLPSTWEGWGLPVVEAAAAGKLVVAGPYPVLDEIRGYGIVVFDPSEVARVAELIDNPASARPVIEGNLAAVRTHFDLSELPAVLRDLARRAQDLKGRPCR
jgi:mannosylglucosylglycerate synthase